MRNRLPMVFSITALLVAVLGVTPFGEAAYNAVVPKNSVGTPQLQRNAVKAAKIAPNAIRGGHVLDGTLLAADFKAGQIPQGPKGDKGDTGSQGPPGLSQRQIVTAETAMNSDDGKTVSATCPAGKVLVGGGAHAEGAFGSVALRVSNPSSNIYIASAVEVNPTLSTWRLIATAICVVVAS